MVAPEERDLLRQTLEHRKQLIRHRRDSGSRRLLREIRAALERLKSGTYGFCEVCHLRIPWGELIAEPERRHCARCAPALEGALG